MPVSDFVENAVLDAIFNSTAFSVTGDPWVSLHTGFPGETGSNEVAGGSYARQQAAFGAAASGALSNSANIDFASMPDLTATPVLFIGLWSAVSAGNFLLYGPCGGAGVRGVFSCEADTDIFTSKGHGLTTNDRVYFSAEGTGQTLPTGVTEGTVYFVIATGLTVDAFEVSATLGGASIAVSADGNGNFWKVVPKVTNSGDTFRIPTGDFDGAMF